MAEGVPDEGLLPHLIVVPRERAMAFPNRWRIVMAKKRNDRFALWQPAKVRMRRERVGEALKTVFPTVESNGWMWTVSGNDIVLLRLLERA